MLKHTLLPAEGILILEPSSQFEAADFKPVEMTFHGPVRYQR